VQKIVTSVIFRQPISLLSGDNRKLLQDLTNLLGKKSPELRSPNDVLSNEGTQDLGNDD